MADIHIIHTYHGLHDIPQDLDSFILDNFLKTTISHRKCYISTSHGYVIKEDLVNTHERTHTTPNL